MQIKAFRAAALMVGLLLCPGAQAEDTDCSKYKAEYVEIRPEKGVQTLEMDLWGGRFENATVTRGRFTPNGSPPVRILPSMPDAFKLKFGSQHGKADREFSPNEVFAIIEENLRRELRKMTEENERILWKSKPCPAACDPDPNTGEVTEKPEPRKQTVIYQQGYLVNPQKLDVADYPYQAKMKITFEGSMKIQRLQCVPKPKKEDKKEPETRKKSCAPANKFKTDKGGTPAPNDNIPPQRLKNSPPKLKINPNGSFPRTEALRRIDAHLKALRDRRADMEARYDKSAIQTLTEAFQKIGVYQSAMGYAKGWASNTLPLVWLNDMRGFYNRHEANLAQSRTAIAARKTATIKAADILYIDQGMSAWEIQEQQLVGAMEEYILSLAEQARELGEGMKITDDPRYYDYNRYPDFKKSKEPEVAQHRAQAKQQEALSKTRRDSVMRLGKGTLFSPINAPNRVAPPPPPPPEEDCDKDEAQGLDYHTPMESTPGKEVNLKPHPFNKRDSLPRQ